MCFKNGHYYLLQVVELHSYKGDQGSSINGTNILCSGIIEKTETLDNWTLHQVLHEVLMFFHQGVILDILIETIDIMVMI